MEKDLRNSELFEEQFKWKERRENGRFFLLVGLVFVLLFSVVFAWRQTYGGVEVDGASMNMTLSDKDKLLMRYVSGGVQPKRGDVIVVDVRGYDEFNGTGTEFLIKRLIAVEGDSLYCVDGDVFIRYAGATDYVKLQEDYTYFLGNGLTKPDCDFASFDDPYDVGVGEVFFLGDNRNNSLDSRFKEGASRLKSLYKASDVYGIVPEWAIEYKTVLSKIFFAW